MPQHEEPREPAVDGHDDLGEGQVEVAPDCAHQGQCPDEEGGEDDHHGVEAEVADQGNVLELQPQGLLVSLQAKDLLTIQLDPSWLVSKLWGHKHKASFTIFWDAYVAMSITNWK